MESDGDGLSGRRLCIRRPCSTHTAATRGTTPSRIVILAFATALALILLQSTSEATAFVPGKCSPSIVQDLRWTLHPPNPREQRLPHIREPPWVIGKQQCFEASSLEVPCCYPSGGDLVRIRRKKPLVRLINKVKNGAWTRGVAIVVLYYARWCPYSQAILPLMECLPQHFLPSKLQFFAADESEVGLRTMIQLGVDSFPTLHVVVPPGKRSWSQSVSVNGPRQLQSIVDEISAIAGLSACNKRQEYNRALRSAQCPSPRSFAPHQQHGDGRRAAEGNRTECQAGWGVGGDWEQLGQCTGLLTEAEDKFPMRPGDSFLAWLAVAFVAIRFGYLWYSRGHPQEQVANNGGDGAAAAQGGGEQQQQQIDGEGRGAQEREENNDGN